MLMVNKRSSPKWGLLLLLLLELSAQHIEAYSYWTIGSVAAISVFAIVAWKVQEKRYGKRQHVRWPPALSVKITNNVHKPVSMYCTYNENDQTADIYHLDAGSSFYRAFQSLPISPLYCTFKWEQKTDEKVRKWRQWLQRIGIVNVIFDAFLLYLPVLKEPNCLEDGVKVSDDHEAAIILTFMRTLGDLSHLLYMLTKFCTASEAQGARIFGKTNLIFDPCHIGVTYVKSFYFFIDLLAILPIPQIVLWTSPNSIRITLDEAIAYQMAPRMLSMLPIDTKRNKEAGIVFKSPWSGAIFNLSVFIVVGHYIGAVYYQLYISELVGCLRLAPEIYNNASSNSQRGCTQVHDLCLETFDKLEHGTYSDAFKNKIGLKSFVQKVIYCFVWGVRSLSSLGQTFDASYETIESSFSCLIMIVGLILLADLIARMQTTVQSAGARQEKQRVKQRKLEEWTHYHNLPPVLKGLVRQNFQLEWQGTKGIDDEGILNSLPSSLQHDIRNHLYKNLLGNIAPFSRMDEELLNFVCGHLRTFTKAEGTYIVLQGDPLDQVVFIYTGLLQLTTHHGSGRSNSRNLEAGDFFGDDLLTWASQPNSSTQNLPTSNVTVRCISNVEAFCLPAEHLRLLVVFNYIHRFQRTLREHHA